MLNLLARGQFAFFLLAAAVSVGAAVLPDFAWLGHVAAVLVLLGVAGSWPAQRSGAESSEADPTDEAAVAEESARASEALKAAVTAAELHEREARQTHASLAALAKRLSAGDLAARIGAAEGVDPAVAQQVDAALAEINTAVDEALALADIAAAGDLSARASGSYHGHCAALTTAMNGLLDSLATIVSTITEAVADNAARGVEMRTVASAVLDHSQKQASSLATLETGIGAVEEGLRHVADLSNEGLTASGAAYDAASDGRQRIEDAKNTMDDILKAATEINSVLEMIDTISQQTTLLSVNAGVEAARAGTAGRGFAVVTEEIGHLAGRTKQASRTISEIVARTNEHVARGSKMVMACDQSISAIVDAASTANDCARRIGEACDAELGRVQQASAEVMETKASADANLDLAARANAVAEALDATAHELDEVVAGFRLEDHEMASAVQQRANEIAARLEAAVAAGDISLEALFSTDYEPIEGTNPQQFSTPYVALTDRVFTPVLEGAFELGEEIAFSAAVNTDGFLPTHNRKFSQRPSADAVWNAANCRNRRFFDDRVGLGAGRNRNGAFLQVYRRDMGGGNYVTMKDISAPISVRGRHWGGLRIGYRPEPKTADKVTISRESGTPHSARSGTR